jgi:hypothetical protein
MIAGLAAADLMTVCAELQGMSVPGDSVVWVNGCEVLGTQVLAELIARGRGAGMAVVLGTASAGAAHSLSAEVNVLVARGPVDPALVGRFVGANRASPDGVTGTPDAMTAGGAGAAAGHAFGMSGGGLSPAGVPPLGYDGFALLSREPQRRVLPQCRHVPAPAGGGSGAAGAGAAGWPA